MGALCNFTPYLNYSALISFFWSVCLILFLLIYSLLLSKQLYSGSYIIRIASLQVNHGYCIHKLKNKNKNRIRQSWKIYRVKYSHLLLYYSLLTIHLFLCYTTSLLVFKIFSIAESYQITYSFNT